ncbi:HNH endonuclease [Shinella zoogloeoides]|uniref:HNH endonuclease n=1 Tax=Shinella zoogloeoides TaxID=352475 RepID=UPI001F5910FD|nr:HNH endonuclease signature motif containing protein [Shinella zoogloeoides]
MPKLKTLKPMVRTIKGMIAMPKRDQHRDAAQPWRAWYKTARWQKLRMQVLIRDRFTCKMEGCGKVDIDTSQLVADHREPHRGDARLFWDAKNLQCLCKPCHDSLKQKQEIAGRSNGKGGHDGL